MVNHRLPSLSLPTLISFYPTLYKSHIVLGLLMMANEYLLLCISAHPQAFVYI